MNTVFFTEVENLREALYLLCYLVVLFLYLEAGI